MLDAPKTIDPSNPRNFCNAVLGQMSKRDKDDLIRLGVNVGDITLLRMVAARYMDPYFVNGEVDAIYKAFGAAVEAAYQEMIAQIKTIDDRRKTLAYVLASSEET